MLRSGIHRQVGCIWNKWQMPVRTVCRAQFVKQNLRMCCLRLISFYELSALTDRTQCNCNNITRTVNKSSLPCIVKGHETLQYGICIITSGSYSENSSIRQQHSCYNVIFIFSDWFTMTVTRSTRCHKIIVQPFQHRRLTCILRSSHDQHILYPCKIHQLLLLLRSCCSHITPSARKGRVACLTFSRLSRGIAKRHYANMIRRHATWDVPT